MASVARGNGPIGNIFERIIAIPTLIEAFDRVEANRGCPGVDGRTIEEFGDGLESNLARLRNELRSGSYRPDPLLRVLIEKRDGGSRPLSIPTVRDRVAQTAAALIMTPLLEPEFEDVSFAYRQGRSVEQAVRRITALRQQGYHWVLDADITRYFDEIPHDKLLSTIARFIDDTQVLDLVALWLTTEVIDGDRRYRLSRGVPQGSPLSPVLANLFLDRFDKAHVRRGYRLVRYGDDFVVLCKSQPEAEAALELSEEMLGRLRLSLNKEKTRIVHFNQGFRYLGVQFLRSMAFRPLYPEDGALEGPAIPIAPSAVGHAVSGKGTGDSRVADIDPEDQTVLAKAMRDALTKLPAEEASVRWRSLAEEAPEADVTPPASGHDPILRTLYLMEQGAELAKENERFLVRKGGACLADIPVMKVDQILAFGNVRLTTPAMQFCLMEDIPIFLLSSRGRYYGVIESSSRDKVSLHREQFLRASDPKWTLNVSRELMRGKLSNTRTLLQRIVRRGSVLQRVQAAGDVLKKIIGQLDGARSLEELRGYEGAAAAQYFAVWPELVGEAWGFEGRKRQPPPDPVNSLLSFGYTILFYNIYSLLRVHGLHPHIGIYHALRDGHAALASDMMEEFRAPIVDATVLSLIHRKQVHPQDFQWPQETGLPCLLTDQARQRVTHAFEAALNRPIAHPDAAERCDYRRAIALQIRRLVAVVQGDRQGYQPFIPR